MDIFFEEAAKRNIYAEEGEEGGTMEVDEEGEEELVVQMEDDDEGEMGEGRKMEE